MDDIRTALVHYFEEWNTWATQDHAYPFHTLRPMHAGWKVPDEQSLGELVTTLLPLTNQGHIGTVDNRKIALLQVHEPVEGVPVLQIMQLRPASSDPLGLDHVAFYCKDMQSLVDALAASEYTWEHQSNPGHQWISLWFGDNKREVKFFDHTSLDLGAHELTEASARIKSHFPPLFEVKPL